MRLGLGLAPLRSFSKRLLRLLLPGSRHSLSAQRSAARRARARAQARGGTWRGVEGRSSRLIFSRKHLGLRKRRMEGLMQPVALAPCRGSAWDAVCVRMRSCACGVLVGPRSGEGSRQNEVCVRGPDVESRVRRWQRSRSDEINLQPGNDPKNGVLFSMPRTRTA